MGCLPHTSVPGQLCTEHTLAPCSQFYKQMRIHKQISPYSPEPCAHRAAWPISAGSCSPVPAIITLCLCPSSTSSHRGAEHQEMLYGTRFCLENLIPWLLKSLGIHCFLHSHVVSFFSSFFSFTPTTLIPTSFLFQLACSPYDVFPRLPSASHIFHPQDFPPAHSSCLKLNILWRRKTRVISAQYLGLNFSPHLTSFN